MYSLLNKLSEYIYFYISKILLHTLLLLDFKISETLTKKFVQKLYKMYTKTIQNTKFVYSLHAKIVQIKILFDNECTKNVHQIPTYI